MNITKWKGGVHSSENGGMSKLSELFVNIYWSINKYNLFKWREGERESEIGGRGSENEIDDLIEELYNKGN